jgi:hypothetical protein
MTLFPGGDLRLPLARYRFTATFEADLLLPDYAGSLLRGVFGATLRRAACTTKLPDCKACPLWRSCPYPALFETPPRPTQFEQKFSQVPNPYVIEPPALGTWHAPAGEPLVFHMVLVGADTLRQLPLIVLAWQRALRDGLGPARVRGELVAVAHVQAGGQVEAVWHARVGEVLPHVAELTLPAVPVAAVAALTLQIHTPLRLQREGHPLRVHELTPRTLLSHLLRRTNLMLDLHLGVRPAPFDAPALLAQSESLRDDRSGLRWKDWTRFSARQHQEMTLGGVLGRWRLQGELAPLVPWLMLGQWLHLGKNTTMGLGAYSLDLVA